MVILYDNVVELFIKVVCFFMIYMGSYDLVISLLSIIAVIVLSFSIFKIISRLNASKKGCAKLTQRITKQTETETKLIESNALRRTIIDSLPIGIIVTDINRNVVALNRPFYKLLNTEEPIKDLIGQSSLNYYRYIYRDWEQEMKRINEISSSNTPSVDEIELANSRLYQRNYFPFYMDNVLKGHLWTFEDITERKVMENGIIRAKDEAVKANLAKSEFLSNMSHELRTPLNAILGFSQLLEIKEPLSSQQEMFVQEILKGGRHLLNLINEVLDLSRIEAGRMKISTDAIKIGTVIGECLSLVRPAAINKGIQMTSEQSVFWDRYVYADPTRLKQILLNLLENAIKYNRDNGSVFIRCEGQEDYLYVHICDTGIGIPPQAKEKIFEPFYRMEHPRVEGTGIGLSLVKRFIQLMGGKVGVKSRLGEGSDFWISLPMVRSEHPIHQPSLEQPVFSFPQNKEFTILYIEDHLSNIQLVDETLRTIEGVTLLSARTGMAGLQIAKEQKVNLILLDLDLPDINGFAVLEKLKSSIETKSIPVIAVSANAMRDAIDRGIMKGFNEYITKPIDVSAFLNVISKYVK
jgi:signal transduction histidine kinase